MRSLVKKVRQPSKSAPAKAARPVSEPKVAQCCAKVSKAVAGCHD